VSKCIVCGKDANPAFRCVRKDMEISLCGEHADECIDCDVGYCEHKRHKRLIKE
jgi:hypothetical protein